MLAALVGLVVSFVVGLMFKKVAPGLLGITPLAATIISFVAALFTSLTFTAALLALTVTFGIVAGSGIRQHVHHKKHFTW